MKKLLSITLVSMALAGCANVPPTMPVDSNPSKALQFARAMDLRQITDAGDNYVVYNGMTDKCKIVPLKVPVRPSQKGAGNYGGVTADIAAGFATHTAFIPVLSVLTARTPAPVVDGMARVGSWNNMMATGNYQQIEPIVRKTLKSMHGYIPGPVCGDNKSVGSTLIKRPAQNGEWVSYEDVIPTLPSPPIVVDGKASFFLLSNCFFKYSSQADNVPFVKQMSVELGPSRAVFLPGSHEHPPMVFHNGETYYFNRP
ncbi:hypothetical protein [Photorhabdus bodei]|uniref:Lipoprotein n=1 Tax=Photorhabdus bodei TaxID=2029681 RepID=A0AAW6BMH1_9GAMM|nr:hypothetical protein [Photorhabdus bodei]MDB6373840.1 hypothetical protein [Photorhabdus bodei]